jgi:hypothetical protein
MMEKGKRSLEKEKRSLERCEYRVKENHNQIVHD